MDLSRTLLNHRGYTKSDMVKMSPEKKLEVAMQLYYSARELEAAGMRTAHPDWDENQVQQAVLEAFLYTRS